MEIKKLLIRNGVNNLKYFGYKDVNEENIFSDFMYRDFFKRMLEDNLGHREDVDKVINELLNKIQEHGN